MHVEPDSLPTGHEGIVPRLQKGPTIHSSAWVVSGATVLGDVVLEEESSVWYGAVLRGDINRIIIGPRSNIQDNAVVHVDSNYPTTMGELVTVGHNAGVHACRIDSEVLVGMSAIILDDVEVCARSIIDGNALVTFGMKSPPGSLVRGSHACIRRQRTGDISKNGFPQFSCHPSHARRSFSLEALSIQTSLACNDHISIFDFRFESDCVRDNIEARPNFCAAKAHQAEAESACGASTWF